jgi:hypothetical protein
MKSIRTLGLLAIAAMALIAFTGAGTASASQFRAEKYPASIVGSQVVQPVITLSGGNIKCPKNYLSGTLVSASGELPVDPTSSGTCTAFGVKTTISTNSCKFVFNSTNESAPYSGTFGVACSKGGDSILYDAPSLPCKVTIPAQASLGSVEFANTGINAHRAVTATLQVSNLKYTKTGVGCPGQGTFETGKITGSYSIEARSKAEPENAEEEGIRNGFYLANEQVAPGPALLRAELFPVKVAGSAFGTSLETPAGYQINGNLGLETSLSAASGVLNLTPGFSGFTYFGSKVVFTNNGCYLAAHLSSEITGTADIVCPAGQSISVKSVSSNCVENILPQTGLNAVGFKNIGTETTRAVEITLALTGMKYTTSGSECPKAGSFEGGLKSTVPLKGFNAGGGQEGIWTE